MSDHIVLSKYSNARRFKKRKQALEEQCIL